MSIFPRIVLDTGVYLQAALNPDGPAASVIRHIEAGDVTAFICPRVRSEIEVVLDYPELRSKYSRLTDERAMEILQRIDAIVQMVPNPPRYVEYPRDPKDEPPLNLAVEVRADYLISRDKDLLSLDTDTDFRARFNSLRVVDPVVFLTEIQPPPDS